MAIRYSAGVRNFYLTQAFGPCDPGVMIHIGYVILRTSLNLVAERTPQNVINDVTFKMAYIDAAHFMVKWI